MKDTRWSFRKRRCSVLENGRRCTARRTATVDECAFYCARHLQDDTGGEDLGGIVLSGRLFVEGTYFTNVRRGEKKPPKGDWWIYYLTGHRLTPKGRRGRRFLKVLMAPTRAGCNRKLRAFVERPEVTLGASDVDE
jgi:hypothetical protein